MNELSHYNPELLPESEHDQSWGNLGDETPIDEEYRIIKAQPNILAEELEKAKKKPLLRIVTIADILGEPMIPNRRTIVAGD